MQPEFVLWLDNQLPPALAKWIKEEYGWQVSSAYSLGIQQATDHEIFEKAKELGNVIIMTKDGDFVQLTNRYQAPPKILKLDTGNMPAVRLWEFLKPVLPGAIRMLTTEDVAIVFIRKTIS